MISFIDTHCHLDGEEFAEDRQQVIQRAREAGAEAIFIPAIDLKSCHSVIDTCAQYPSFCYPMLGLHPEEVRSDWRQQLKSIRDCIDKSLTSHPLPLTSKTVPRDEYRLVQTPQTFDIQLLKAANRQPYNDGFTDDASVVESYGHKITLVEGNRENIKITTPYDITVAEAIINIKS